MASPFRFFRRYAGWTMAVLCALLMFAFVVADPLTQLLGAGGRGPSANAKEMAVSWNGGQLTERELGELVRHRQVLAAFQQQVAIMGYQSAAAAGAGDLPPRVQPLALASTPEQGVERDVVRSKILADAARDAGMVVGDETIRDYLQGLGRDRVTNQMMRTLLGQLQTGVNRRATIEYIFDLLRDAMLARNFINSHQYALETVLPQERWQDWLRENDRVVVEAAAVRTEDFIDKVEDPTDAELTAFFDEHKDRVQGPERVGMVELPSPTPGFATPQKVQLQYLKTDLDATTQSLLESVTDEEIETYYNENKERFIKADTDFMSGSTLFGDDEPESTPDDVADDNEADGNEADNEATSSPEPTTEDSTTESNTESTEAVEEPETPSEDEQSRSSQRPSPFRLVALQEETEDAASSDSDSNDSEPTETEDAKQESAEQSDPLSEFLAGGDDSDDAGSSTATEESGEEAEEKVEYQPLDEVRDQIRRLLAEEKASSQLKQLTDRLDGQLNAVYTKYFSDRLDASAAEEPTPEPPAELKNLEQLAEKEQLTYEKTGELSLLDLRDTPLGKTVVADETASQQIPLWYQVLREGEVEDFEPFVTYDSSGNRYVVMRIKNTPRETPELDEVRDQVVRAWKMQKAADLALAEAEKLAKEAEEKGVPLAEFFSGNEEIEVVETDPFSWLTFGMVSPTTRTVEFRLGDAEPLEAAGPVFMEKVFNLKPRELGAVLNHDQTVAYIVRIVQHLSSKAELRQDFLAEGTSWYGLPTMTQQRSQKVGNALYLDLFGDSDLDWRRPPDTRGLN